MKDPATIYTQIEAKDKRRLDRYAKRAGQTTSAYVRILIVGHLAHTHTEAKEPK
jgi:predicted DNA-binding protein